MTRLRDRLVELGALGPAALFVVAAPFAGALVLIATSDSWLDPLRGAAPISGGLLFIAAAVPLCALSLIPTHAASLTAGLVFGAIGGSLVALACVVLAAAGCHLLLEGSFGRRGERLLERRPRARAVHGALVRSGEGRAASLVALVRLSPVMPFAGTNLLCATAGVGARPFVLGSAVGLAPRVIIVAVAGAGLSELDLTTPTDGRWALIGALATLLALVLVGRIARQALRRATRAVAPGSGDAAPDHFPEREPPEASLRKRKSSPSVEKTTTLSEPTARR